MILFYNKKTGKVFATVDGRVHSQQQMECHISDGTPKKEIGKFIIGWEETGKTKKVSVEKEIIEEKEIEAKDGKKYTVPIKKKIVVKEDKSIVKKHNMDKFKQLQKFENNDPEENPLNYSVKNNKLILKI